MCVYSMVLDYGRKQWPLEGTPVQPQWPQIPTWPTQLPTKQELDEFRRLLEQARQFDKIAKQPDCEDPTKVEWLKRLVAVMERVEKKLEA